MSRDDEPTTDRRREDQFGAIIHTMLAADPRFARRVAPRAPGWPATAGLAIIAGIVATVLAGIVPLVLGLHTAAPMMIILGAGAILVLPVTVPFATLASVSRMRPNWA